MAALLVPAELLPSGHHVYMNDDEGMEAFYRLPSATQTSAVCVTGSCRELPQPPGVKPLGGVTPPGSLETVLKRFGWFPLQA